MPCHRGEFCVPFAVRRHPASDTMTQPAEKMKQPPAAVPAQAKKPKQKRAKKCLAERLLAGRSI